MLTAALPTSVSSPKRTNDDRQLRPNDDGDRGPVGQLLLALFDGLAVVTLLGLPVLVALLSAPGRTGELKLAATAAIIGATATVAGQRLGRLPTAVVLRPSTFAVGGYQRALTRVLALSFALAAGAYGGRAAAALGAGSTLVFAVGAVAAAGLTALGSTGLAGSSARESGRRAVVFGVGVALLAVALFAAPANPLARPLTALYATLWFVDGLPALFAAGRAVGFGREP